VAEGEQERYRSLRWGRHPVPEPVTCRWGPCRPGVLSCLRSKDAEAKLRRFQAAIEAGIEPAALVEAINQAQAQRAAARAELDNTPVPDAVTEAEVYAKIDSMGDVAGTLTGKHPDQADRLVRLPAVGHQVRQRKEAIDVMASVRVNSGCVQGGFKHMFKAPALIVGVHVTDDSYGCDRSLVGSGVPMRTSLARECSSQLSPQGRRQDARALERASCAGTAGL
jgi:hypothetical protein